MTMLDSAGEKSMNFITIETIQKNEAHGNTEKIHKE